MRTGETVIGDQEDFDPSFLLRWPAVMSGAQHYYDRLPSGGGLHCWDKRGYYERNSFSDADVIWCSKKSNSQVFRLVWRGICRHSENTEKIVHPTQKPVLLMIWMMSLLGVPDKLNDAVVLDPFMGSGTTGVACARVGARFVGIELLDEYWEAARERISREIRKVKTGFGIKERVRGAE